MAISPEVAISSMWPSGGALATAFAAIMPAAPTRFSTMTGRPARILERIDQQARRDVDAAAGRKTRDDPDGAVLRRGPAGEQRCARARHQHASCQHRPLPSTTFSETGSIDLVRHRLPGIMLYAATFADRRLEREPVSQGK